MPTETINIDDRWSDEENRADPLMVWMKRIESKLDRIEAANDRIIAELDDDEAAKGRLREMMDPK